MSKPRRGIPRDIQEQSDLVELCSLPAFRRFLFRIYSESGIAASAYGSEDRHLHATEGRRSLGFEILRWADDARSLPQHSTLLAILGEELQPTGGLQYADRSEPDDDTDDDDRFRR